MCFELLEEGAQTFTGDMSAEGGAQLGGCEWTGLESLQDFILERVCRPIPEDVQSRVLGIAPHGKGRIQVGFLDFPLGIQECIEEGKAEGLGFGPVDNAPGQTCVLLGELWVVRWSRKIGQSVKL